MPITIIVHGGAGDLPPERYESAQAGCHAAALVGWRILQNGGSALDAVEAAVRALEDNPDYNAGTGSTLTREGKIELDAGIMDGQTLNVGAVACVQGIQNPISLARRILESPHALLMGRGAHEFAQEQGIQLCEPDTLLTERQRQRWQQAMAKQAQQEETEPRYHRQEVGSTLPPADEPRYHRQEVGSTLPPVDEPRYHRQEVGSTTPRSTTNEPEEKHGTVGAVAVDSVGHLAAATSTGGIFLKYPGRVGDTPLVGCGFYADEQAAVSCTGQGEDFVRLLIAKRAADFVARGSTAQAAAQAGIAVLGAKAQGDGGLIVVDVHGNAGFAWNSPHMAYAYMSEGLDEPVAGN